jgi:hypothetical protein
MNITKFGSSLSLVAIYFIKFLFIYSPILFYKLKKIAPILSNDSSAGSR